VRGAYVHTHRSQGHAYNLKFLIWRALNFGKPQVAQYDIAHGYPSNEQSLSLSLFICESHTLIPGLTAESTKCQAPRDKDKITSDIHRSFEQYLASYGLTEIGTHTAHAHWGMPKSIINKNFFSGGAHPAVDFSPQRSKYDLHRVLCV
jgi:hypothetical protein